MKTKSSAASSAAIAATSEETAVPVLKAEVPAVGSKRSAAAADLGENFEDRDGEDSAGVSSSIRVTSPANENSFEQTLNEVKAFVFKYGELPRQKRIREDGDDEKRLLLFLNNQRQKKKLDKLSPERTILLESIPGFFWTGKERCPEQFEKTVSDLKEFVARFRDLPKTNCSRDDNERTLAIFLSNQRQHKKENKISPERAALMETVEFFTWTGKTDRSFEESVNDVKAFVAETNGDFPKHNSDGLEKRLNSFVNHQKQKKKENKLSEARIAMMESIPGFQWSDRERTVKPFAASVDDVKAFVAEFGELPRHLGKRSNNDEKRLAIFIDTHRKNKKDGKMKKDRVELMESIPGFTWVGRNESKSFDGSVDAIKTFIALYGEMPKHKGSRQDGEEKRLATFLGNIRQKKRSDKVSEARIRAVESIPGFSWQDRSRPIVSDEIPCGGSAPAAGNDDIAMGAV